MLLSREEWQCLNSLADADHLFSSFLSTFLHHFNKAFPLKSHFPRKFQANAWITQETRLEAKHLRSLHRKLKVSNNSHDCKQQYLNLKKSHAKNIRQAKLQFNDHVITSSNNIPKATWSMIKSQTTAPVSKVNLSIVVNEQPISDPSSLANHFNNFFINSSISQSASTSLNSSNTPVNNNICHAVNYSIFLYPTTKNEVIQVAKKLGSKHSCGLDEVPGSLLAKCVHLIAAPLEFLINESFSSGIFPSELKKARVIPIYKHKGKKSDMNNYRPISVLSSFSKIFECIMHERLISFLNYHSLLSPSQHGFLKNKSTTTAIFSFLSPLYSALDKGDHAVGLFYDLSKAFDTIDHNILLSKLDRYGIRGVANKWMASYLSDRTQAVEIQASVKHSTKKFLSESKAIVSGVPQGSILGPLAFIVYVNDLPDCFDNGTLTQYADDSSHRLIIPKENASALPAIVNKQAS